MLVPAHVAVDDGEENFSVRFERQEHFVPFPNLTTALWEQAVLPPPARTGGSRCLDSRLIAFSNYNASEEGKNAIAHKRLMHLSDSYESQSPAKDFDDLEFNSSTLQEG